MPDNGTQKNLELLEMGKKIAIVGAGAVGGYAGAHMVQQGEDVTFIDFWPENVEKNARGRAQDQPYP